MTNHSRLPLAGFFIALALSLNAFGEEAFSEEAMMIKASELTKLSTAVESAVHYEGDRSAGLEGPALLQFATKHDPGLLSRFSGYEVKVLAKDGHAVVLICTAGGHRALLEDAGCTASMDRHAWNEGADTPCEFRLDLPVLCAAPAGDIEPRPEAKAIRIPEPAPITRFVEIDKAVWTTAVNMGTKQPESDISRSTVGSRLVLWMRVKGTEEALSKLSAEGKLPIRHKWFRGTITGFRAAGVEKPADEIEIPAGQRGAVEKLATEVRTLGYFSWRTWSSKEKPARGHWRVTVVYSDNTPVLCGASSGSKPCEYEIEVR